MSRRIDHAARHLATVVMGSVVIGLMASATSAETRIEVSAGQTLSEADLESGVFAGQTFELGPETVFEVSDGGVIGSVGGVASPLSDLVLLTEFDFGGSRVNVRGGAVCQ